MWQHPFWDRFVRLTKEINERLTYMHLNAVRIGLMAKPQGWQWSSYNNFALEKAVVARCPIQVDFVWLPEGCRT